MLTITEPKDITLHHSKSVNPILKVRILNYRRDIAPKIEQCFIEHDLRASNYLQVQNKLSKELSDVSNAICLGDIKKAKKELEELAIIAAAFAILSAYIISLYPSA